MNRDTFAEWLRRQGYPVIRTASSHWFRIGGCYQACPYHELITPDEEEIREILQVHRAVAVRYSAPFDAPVGAASYHVVYEEKDYDLSGLTKKARYDVRKSLALHSAGPIELARLAEEGWQLRRETLLRQGRIGAETAGWWRKLCLSAEGLEGFEAWAVSSPEQMAASLLAHTCGDCCSILYQQSRSDLLRLGVNNALTFAFVSQALQRPGVRRVFYGHQSLDAPAGIDRFKFRMGFKAKPVRQRVEFNRWLRPWAGRPTARLARRLADWSGNDSLGKAAGMLRLFIEGQKPLRDQEWPEPIGSRNE